MLHAEKLQFTYYGGTFRLFIDNFRAKAGESTAIIGPSGSGKTTLLKLLSGLYKPDSGKVQLGDIEVSELNDRQRRDFRIARVGFIFQDFRLIDYLNVMDNIIHTYRLNSSLKLTTDVKERACSLAQSVGIEHLLKRKITKLSQGEKQRVAICRALLSKPEVILADEATGNLDPESKKNVLNILMKYTRENNAALIAVTHDHELLGHFDEIFDFRSLTDQVSS